MPGRGRELATSLALVVALGAALISVPVVRSFQLPSAPSAALTRTGGATTAPSATPAAPALELGLSDLVPAAPAAPAPSPSPAARRQAAASPLAPPAPLAADLQARVDEALVTLGYPWRELGYGIRFVPYTGGLLGLADPTTRQITVFVKATSTVQQLRVVLAHEIGHALDDRTGTSEQRDRYRRLRAIPAELPWYPCDTCEDYDSPAGDFAEVFAAWLVGPTDFRSRLAPLPDADQLRQLTPLFAPLSARTAAAPAEPPQPRPSASPTPTRRPGLLDLTP